MFGMVYRQVYDRPAPLSTIVQLVGKHDVPVRGRNRSIIEYLTFRRRMVTATTPCERQWKTSLSVFAQNETRSLIALPATSG